MQRIIEASYTTCCFCDKPILPTGNIIKDNGTFKFKEAADLYCKTNNLQCDNYSNKNRSMIATMDYKCSHRDKQYIRIEWGIKY